MRVGLQIIVVPTDSGGIHIRVSPLELEEHKAARSLPDVVSQRVSKSPVVADETELRLWVNSVARLVARTLEDDLYEREKASISRSNARGDDPYKNLAGVHLRGPQTPARNDPECLPPKGTQGLLRGPPVQIAARIERLTGGRRRLCCSSGPTISNATARGRVALAPWAWRNPRRYGGATGGAARPERTGLCM